MRQMIDDSRLPAPTEVIAARKLTLSSVDLFRFSAAVGLSHRIHYDQRYAQHEGHRDILVHGPLLGAQLGELVSAWARQRGGRLMRFSFRNVAPGYVDERLVAGARVKSVNKAARRARCDLWVDRTKDGVRLVIGTADLVFPAD